MDSGAVEPGTKTVLQATVLGSGEASRVNMPFAATATVVVEQVQPAVQPGSAGAAAAVALAMASPADLKVRGGELEGCRAGAGMGKCPPPSSAISACCSAARSISAGRVW